MTRPFPAATKHGDLAEIFPGVHFVTGTVTMAAMVTTTRNMVAVLEGERVVLVNAIRLNEEGLAQLDRLGRVTDVIRLAGFHGMDDPFYKDRYDAKIWGLPGMSYQRKFDAAKRSDKPYFTADAELTDNDSPLQAASLYTFGTRPPEGLLLLEGEGGILISGDSMQNWGQTTSLWSLPAKLIMRALGFIKPYNLGPGWLRAAKPTQPKLQGILELPFEHLLPAHGEPVLGDAKQKYRKAIEAACAS